jgi:uncharacterized membrane protein YeaQ/YmgE (transglycosylase-associated protein family)
VTLETIVLAIIVGLVAGWLAGAFVGAVILIVAQRMLWQVRT